jgi:hypothetical protein
LAEPDERCHSHRPKTGAAVANSVESSIIHDANQAAIPAVGFVWSDFNTLWQLAQPADFEIGFVRSIYHDTLSPANSAQFEIGFVRQNLI